MRITELRAENVKRLKAVTVRPDKPLVTVCGNNGEGKSSLLDSILYALAGAKSFDDEPVRRGADHAEVTLEISGDDDQPPLTVTRTIDASGKTKLEIRETGDDYSPKLAKPQQILDALVGRIAFDPLEFARQKPKDQATTLQDLVGLDFSGLDAQRDELYEQRTDVNRDLKREESLRDSLPHFDDAPESLETVGELADQLEKAHEHNREIDRQTQQADKLSERAQQAADAADKADAEIADLQAQIARLRKQAANHRANAIELDGQAELLRDRIGQPVDTEAIQKRLSDVEFVNDKVRSNREWRQAVDECKRLKELSDDLSNQIKSLDVRRQALVERAELPLDGLGFSEDGVTYQGLPFSQASSAERLKVSAAIGLAMNPTLRVMLIKDGPLLDADSLQVLNDLAERHDAQVWVERVGRDENCSVLIEDGEVAACHN